MHRGRLVIGAFLAMGLAGAGLCAGAQGSSTAPAADTSRMIPTPATEVPDFTGEWRLDFSRSDSLRGPGGPGGPRGSRMGRGGGGPRPGGWGGGGRMGRGRDGEARPGEGGSRPIRLPSLMHVTHAETLVSFEDSTGTVIQEITTVAAEADTFAHAPGAQQLKGRWNANRLEVQHTGRGGAKVTDIYSLEDGGRSLVNHTAIAASGDMPAREFKRVYRRES